MKKFNNKGFSMVEAIIMIAVLTTVMVMAFPNFIEFFKLQEEVSEERTMNEIRTALKLYADANKELPELVDADDGEAWFEKIARFTSLTENAIQNDVWGNPRHYRMLEDNLTYRSSNDVRVTYAVVYGFGPDGDSTNATAAGAMDWDNYFTSVNGDDGARDYAELEVSDANFDDSMIKITNYAEQVRNYEETEKRLQAISDALANYAIAKFNAAQLLDPADPGYVANSEELNYYPPSEIEYTLDADNSDYRFVEGEIEAAMNRGAGARIRVASGTLDDNNERKDDMQALMRLLGLPLSYCCSALEIDEFTGEEPAFFYYSNPMPLDGAGGCDNRPDPGETRLPPRLSVTPDACG